MKHFIQRKFFFAKIRDKIQNPYLYSSVNSHTIRSMDETKNDIKDIKEIKRKQMHPQLSKNSCVGGSHFISLEIGDPPDLISHRK